MKQNLTIGKLAKSAGVGVETVRFYERRGLLRRPAKSGGFRVYDVEDPARIRFIKGAQDVGFSLAEAKELLELNSNPRGKCTDIRKAAERKLQEVERKIKDLNQMKRSLRALASACGTSERTAAECQLLSCFESGWRCE